LKVQAAEKEFKQGDVTFPAGSFIIAGDAAKVRPAVEALGLTAVGLAAAPQVPMHDLDLPRVAVYSTWGSTQDVGWVRFGFDKFEVSYDLIYKERVREGISRTPTTSSSFHTRPAAPSGWCSTSIHAGRRSPT